MRIADKEFADVRVLDRPVSFSDLGLDRVTFVGCRFAHWKGASYPSAVRNVTASRCRLRGGHAHGIRSADFEAACAAGLVE